MPIKFSKEQLEEIKKVMGTHCPNTQMVKNVVGLISEELEPDDEEDKKYRAAAQERQKDGELEVDEDAVVSKGDGGGAYVQAWIWVENADAGIGQKYHCKNCDGSFNDPDAIGQGLGVASPCCKHHFGDDESDLVNRPCSRTCCAEVDPLDAAAVGYKGT